jgi:hypothetical protein
VHDLPRIGKEAGENQRGARRASISRPRWWITSLSHNQTGLQKSVGCLAGNNRLLQTG